MRDAPIFLTVRQVQNALGRGWSLRSVRRWLHRAGALERRYGTLVVSPEQLIVTFPEVFRRILEEQDAEDDE